MQPIKRSIVPLIGALLTTAPLLTPAYGQIETPQGLNAEATNAMEGGKWEDALKLLTQCVERFDDKAMQLYGPQFGVTWYRKGICEMRLKRWEDAMASFQACYERYPNNSEQAQGGGNAFNKRALLRWAEAAQGAGQWETALKMYEKFIQERDKTRDGFAPGSFYINLAICNFKLKNVSEGNKHFETALKNKDAYKTPGAGIVNAFQALVGAVIETKDEKSLTDFLNSNRADILIEPYEMPPYAPVFLKLAAEAFQAGMQTVAMELYQLIPSTQVMLEDAQSRLARMGDRAGIQDGSRVLRRSELSDTVARLKKSISGGNPNEVIQLAAVAFIHESAGNVRGAYESYLQLEELYPKSKNREDYLYNLVRTASMTGHVPAAEKYGNLFRQQFPDSEHLAAIHRLMLTTLFFNGQYELCIEIAEETLGTLEEGTPEHDMCLFVLGGSKYYTGRYSEAQELLDQHVKLYPESQFVIPAHYFQASNKSREQYWAASAELLDKFIADYPDAGENLYLPFAIYDRANCAYALDELDAALSQLTRLESDFPTSEVMEMALNLKGNILQNQGKNPEAEEAYTKALELAENRGNKIVASEALNYLVGLLGEKPVKKDAPDRAADAVAYADRFWEKYPDSPYKAQVAVGEIYAMQAVGRGDEALERLQGVITELANTPGAAGMEEAIGSFTEAYLEKHSADELKTLYYDFPGIQLENKAARALLRIALIGVFEDQASNAKADEQQKLRANASIKVLFDDLKTAFDVKDLSNFILVRVGDFIRGTKSPKEALPYYSEALSRESNDYKFPALFGRAAVLAKGSDSEKKEAIKDFERVIADSQDRADKDRALFEMIETQMSLGEFEKAKENARLYLNPTDGYNSRKPEVAMILAKAYDQLGMEEDALASFNNVANSYKGAIRLSAPATKRAMEIAWKRNGQSGDVSDRQAAYNLGRTYIDLTRRIVDVPDTKATKEEQAAWKEVEALVQQYVANPDVKSKEQLEEEAKNRR
ncbi:tetratricopeptide (TPR) repeat protein [Haloferula luteola]|uniref:Tetratricopeptide (TPR) repeat protein n=1 Tax=Haloferula luteola TaxID=595692 RepID=A0A840VI84_9BACT|nr:tetratricopeptide repeat protein [Haloferula luteola]MBB5353550.1 tetratricopeptide (TPR) repeat protein [Haloferula luteola]